MVPSDRTLSEPSPSRPGRLKVVPLFDHGGASARLDQDAGRLRCAFHAIGDLRRGSVAGYEVVLGFEGEPARPPAAWSSQGRARDAGPVEAQLLGAALQARHGLAPGCVLAVSLSAAALVTDHVREMLARGGRLEQLLLVIADGGQAVEAAAVCAALEGARGAGATIGLDDACADALDRVVALRPDVLRIGAEFVDGIAEDETKLAVVEALAALAGRTGARLLADGVSDERELRAVAALGAPLAQGPMFGEHLAVMAPLPGATIAALRRPEPAGTARTAAALVEPLPALPARAPLDIIADTFLADPRNDFLVLEGLDGRPAALVERAALLRGEPYERPVTCVSPSTPLPALARKLAERPELDRFQPAVCCDGQGRYVGIVRVDRLLAALGS